MLGQWFSLCLLVALGCSDPADDAVDGGADTGRGDSTVVDGALDSSAAVDGEMDGAMDGGLDGAADAACTPRDYGSCTRADRCEQYTGSFYATYDLSTLCTDGELSECGCDTTGVIGRCVQAEGFANEYEDYYYEGDLSTLYADCEGTWTGPTPDAGMMDAGTGDGAMDATADTAAMDTSVPVTCPALSAPANGSISAPSLAEGATATYACDTGYVLVGQAMPTCESTGAWSDDPATCHVPCPCFGMTELEAIRALTSGICFVDNTATGSTRSLYQEGPSSMRVAAEVEQSGTSYSCAYGCTGTSCGSFPASTTMSGISADQHASCRAQIVDYCHRVGL